MIRKRNRYRTAMTVETDVAGRPATSREVSFGLSSRHPALSAFLEAASRLLVMFTAAFGLNLLLADSLRLESGTGVLLLPLVFWFAVLTLYYRVKRGFMWGTGLLAVGVGLLWYRTGTDPIRYTASGVAFLWNRVMEVIDTLGFVSLPAVGEDLAPSEGAMFVTVSLLSCLILYLFLHKKLRVFPAVGYVLLVSAPLFIYALPLRNDGTALLLAAVAGMIVMGLSEKHAENGGSAGFVGLAALLLSFLLLFVPMLRVKEPMKEIPAFSSTLAEIRQMITDLSMGKNPFGGNGASGESNDDWRDASASDRHFTGKHLMTVYSNTIYDFYLRDWVGGTYEDGRWYLPELDDVDEAYRPASEEDEYYRVTLLALQIYKTMTGDNGAESRLGLYRQNTAVHLTGARSGIPVPVGMISPIRSPYGEKLFPPYRFTSDFLYTCGDLSADTPYEVDVLLPVRFTTEDYRALVEDIYFYRIYAASGFPIEEGSSGYEMARVFGRDGLEKELAFLTARDSQVAALYRHKVESEAIERAVLDLFAESDIKKYYRVISGETESSGENGVITLEEEGGTVTYYLPSAMEALCADEIAFAVSSYLREHYRYSLTPDADASKEAMEDFLYGSKEGYCVQFATAATLMMRRLGFSARYAEGFIAQDFSLNGDDDFDQRYAAKVRDRHAHAWAEFWVPGYGWRILEATPGYSDNVFEETTEPAHTDPPITIFPPDTASDTDPADTDVLTEPDTDGDTEDIPPETAPSTEDETERLPETTVGGTVSREPFDPTPHLIVIGTVLVLLLTGFLLIRRGQNRLRQKTVRMARGKNGCPVEEQEALAKALSEDLIAALAVYRLLPKDGESPTDFGRRADATLAPVSPEEAPSRGVLALSRRIYGGVTEADDLAAMALVTEALMRRAPKHLGACRFFFYRWILCRI